MHALIKVYITTQKVKEFKADVEQTSVAEVDPILRTLLGQVKLTCHNLHYRLNRVHRHVADGELFSNSRTS